MGELLGYLILFLWVGLFVTAHFLALKTKKELKRFNRELKGRLKIE